MLKETAMEAIGIEEAAALQPAVVRGNSVHGVEPQALEHVRGDVRALLGRVDRYWMQGVELRGDHSEQTELHADPPLAQRRSETAGLRSIGVHQLEQPRSDRLRILKNQP